MEKNLKKEANMNNTTIENIQERLNNLSYYHQLCFAYFLAKRLQPNYICFYQQENWGNPEILDKGIHLIKNIILKQSYDVKSLEKLSEKLEEITPDTDEFPSFITSLALDSCACVLETFEFIKNKDTEHLATISTSALDLTQMYIEHRDNSEFDDYAFNDELFIEELSFQIDTIELLENQKIIDEQFLLSQNINKSRLGKLLQGIYFIENMEIDDEVKEWIKKENVNIKELIPDLVRNFYQSIKKLRNNAAL